MEIFQYPHPSEGRGRWFESIRVRQSFQGISDTLNALGRCCIPQNIPRWVHIRFIGNPIYARSRTTVADGRSDNGGSEPRPRRASFAPCMRLGQWWP
jgi:hypothetical protein